MQLVEFYMSWSIILLSGWISVIDAINTQTFIDSLCVFKWLGDVFFFFFTVFLREVVLWHTSGRISVCWIPCEALLVLFSSRLPLKFNEAPGGHFPVDWQQWSLPAESSSLLLSHWLPRKCNMKVCLRLLLQPEITQMMTQRLASLSLWGIVTCRVTSSC